MTEGEPGGGRGWEVRVGSHAPSTAKVTAKVRGGFYTGSNEKPLQGFEQGRDTDILEGSPVAAVWRAGEQA